MKKRSTEFSNFKRRMAKMAANQKKEAEALKKFKEEGKGKKVHEA